MKKKNVIRFQVSKVHALPGFDDCYIHLRNPMRKGGRKVGWIHLEGFNYPMVLRKAKHAMVAIEFELDD